MSATNAAFFVSGADVASLLPPGGSYLTSAQWQCVAITGTGLGFTVGNVYTNPRSASGNTPVVTNSFIGVRIDGGGKVVGVQNVFSGNTALTMSCWTSIGGANAFP